MIVDISTKRAAVVVFNTHLHDISITGSHYTIVVPNATNEEVRDLLAEQGVGVWNNYYITKAVRVLREGGYNPIVLDSAVHVSPHEEPMLVDVDGYFPHDRDSKDCEPGMDTEPPIIEQYLETLVDMYEISVPSEYADELVRLARSHDRLSDHTIHVEDGVEDTVFICVE